MTVKTDRLVTLFGGGGFVGRYVAQSLFRTGVRVRIAEREPKRAFFLKPLAGLGQIQFVRADLNDPEAVAAAVEGAEAVVNLVGILKGRLHRIHVEGARNVAEAAAQAGVAALIHISAIGADPDSESAYGASKGEGELAVRAAFPGATIVRPSIAFGQEDQFVNKFARMAQLLPALPVLRGAWRVQPVHVADLAKAIALAALDPARHAGKGYELGGPQVLTMAELEPLDQRGDRPQPPRRRDPRRDRPDDRAVRLAPRRPDHARSVADAGTRQRSRGRPRIREVRDPPGAARRGGGGLADPLPPPGPVQQDAGRLNSHPSNEAWGR